MQRTQSDVNLTQEASVMQVLCCMLHNYAAISSVCFQQAQLGSNAWCLSAYEGV
jgi:hypothetical protein